MKSHRFFNRKIRVDDQTRIVGGRMEENITLQQEIKLFHEKLNPTLMKVLEQYDNNASSKIYYTIIKPCKKLIQKCSFKSLMDVSSLCSFTYWLYIYGNKELALEICEHSHNVDFAYEYPWFGYPEICGLEIRIVRELFGKNIRAYIPANLTEYYFSKNVIKELKYPQVLREDKINTRNEQILILELQYALYNMIGKGETGFYPELNKNWEKIEEAICMYIDYLNIE